MSLWGEEKRKVTGVEKKGGLQWMREPEVKEEKKENQDG